ncbi:MAG: hypothetical protein JRN68_06620 [Nitrososphaerota archaeon]|nr:hypothetical protein [Nitrososphaerota archaeon]
MSISPKLMKKLQSDRSSNQERYYYLARCIRNRDDAYWEGDKFDTAKFQHQADQIYNIIQGKPIFTEPPPWLAAWAPEECKKFWGKGAK